MKLLGALEKPFYTAVNPLVDRLIRAGVRPNTITTVGTGLVLVSALAYALGHIRLGGALLLLSGVADTLDGQVARGGAMVTKFGAFYDSTLDRVGDGATFIGIGAFLLTAPDVAYRVPAVIACMVAILSSLLVSYARARAEGLGLDCKVGIAQRAERILGLGVASLIVGAGPRALVLEALVALLAVASIITVIQRFAYVYRAANGVEEPRPRPRRARGRAGSSRERTLAVAEQVARRIAPAEGKLGVLCVGLGAVATTFIAGVENVRRGGGTADRLAHPDGHHPARQAHRGPGAADPRLRAAGVARRPRLRRLGSGAGRRLHRRAQGGRARPARAPRADRRLPQGDRSRCPPSSTSTT